MNCKSKSRRRFFLLVRSRTPPISSEFRGEVWTPQTPPLGTPLYFIVCNWRLIVPVWSVYLYVNSHWQLCMLYFVYHIILLYLGASLWYSWFSLNYYYSSWTFSFLSFNNLSFIFCPWRWGNTRKHTREHASTATLHALHIVYNLSFTCKWGLVMNARQSYCSFMLTLRLLMSYIQGVPGGKDLTSGECSLGQTIPI